MTELNCERRHIQIAKIDSFPIVLIDVFDKRCDKSAAFLEVERLEICLLIYNPKVADLPDGSNLNLGMVVHLALDCGLRLFVYLDLFCFVAAIRFFVVLALVCCIGILAASKSCSSA